MKMEQRRTRPKFVSGRQPEMLKGGVITPNAGNAARYYKELSVLIDRMTAQTQKQINVLFKEHSEFFAQDASISSQARILTNSLIKKFDEMFGERSKPIAEGFIEQVNAASTSAVKGAVKELSGGLAMSAKSLQSGVLNEILSASVTENVSLIKSIPQKYLNGVQGATMRSITTGKGLEDLVPYLAKHKEITLKRARMIAFDQTRKVMNNLSEARMIGVGIEEGEWIHIASNHPRKTHVAMNGKIFKLGKGLYDSTEKEYVLPGQLVNCRCKFRAVISFDNPKAKD